MKNVASLATLFVLCAFVSTMFFKAPVIGASEAEKHKTIDLKEWQWRAPIKPDEKGIEEGLVKFRVTPEVYDRTRPDLADLRVLAGNHPLPWVKDMKRGTQRRVPLETELYNPTFRPGELNRVMVDFGGRVMKDSIRVVTPGENFKRRVKVEASQDADLWEILEEESFLFDVPTGPGPRYSRDRVSLPRNDFRYLRITVYHDPDDPEEVPIREVRAWRREGEPAPLESVPVVDSLVEHDRENNLTLVELDLGYRNLPLHRLSLDFEDRNFHRYVTVWGRNQKKREVVRPLEGGRHRKETVEQPWERITSGNIHRYTAGEAYSASLDLEAGPYRYLQVRIHNGDNPPLTFLNAEADRYITIISFPPRKPGPYWLFFGNPDGDMPDYDLKRYVGRLRAEGVTQALIGETAALRYEEPEPVDFSERYRWVLWIALLGAVGLVFWMVWRQAAGLREES